MLFGERRVGGAGGLSARLEGGRRLALTGPSGAGKSTLLRATAGLIDADGELRFRGLSPSQMGYPRWRRQIIYVGQRPVILPGTVRENLLYPFTFKAAEATFDAEAAARGLLALGLEAELDREAQTLSGGERQRLHLLRALLLRPAVLLLDEPSSSLDPESREALIAALLRFSEEGGGLLLVSHDEALRRAVAEEEIAIDPGRPAKGGGPGA